MLSKLVCLKPATANSWHFQDFKKIDIQSNQEMQSFPLTPGSAADGAEADNQASHLNVILMGDFDCGYKGYKALQLCHYFSYDSYSIAFT